MTPEIEQLAREWPMVYELRLPISRQSTCVFVGMYRGRAAELIENVYSPKRVVGFDPQLWALEESKERAQRLGVDWELHNIAVGTHGNGERVPMGEWGTDGCSLVNIHSREKGVAALYEIAATFVHLGLIDIDFFLLNAEGYEYELLPHMASMGMLDTIDLIAVQFHPSLGNALPRETLFNLMTKTHTVRRDEFPQWVLWERTV